MFSNTTSIIFLIIVVVVFLIYQFVFKKGDKSGRSVTPFLDSYAHDFTRMAREGKLDSVVGRADEVDRLAQILARRNKNNAILVGPAGVGKTAIVEGLAQKIVSNEVPEHLLNKRLVALDITNLMSGTKYRGEFEQRAKKIVQELTHSNRSIILFIDEIHSLIQSKGAEGSLNFSDILKPALARGDLQMIGATTTDEYEKYFKTDPTLERRFQPVEVDEPTEEETLIILKGIKDRYRDYHKVEFTDAALETAVKLSKKMLAHRKLPDKAIDAIDEAAAMVKVSHLHLYLPATVLYQAAVQKFPEIADIWKQIQNVDKELVQKRSETLVKRREELEKKLEAKGLVTVDSDDVKKVIAEWATTSSEV